MADSEAWATPGSALPESARTEAAPPEPVVAADDTLGAWPAVVAAMDRHLYSDQLIGEAEDEGDSHYFMTSCG